VASITGGIEGGAGVEGFGDRRGRAGLAPGPWRLRGA
jgi:hypothetical protein